MGNNDLQSELISIAREYAIKMNIIEKSVFKEIENNKEEDIFNDYEEMYNIVFNEYCTNGKHLSGGRAFSFGSPPQFAGIEKSVNQKAEIKNDDIAEVYFQTGSDIETEYIFEMQKKDEQWKIDNAKRRQNGKEKWDNLVL